MRLVECTRQTHADEILQILNEAIVNSTALYDYKPRTQESMLKWFEGKEAGGFQSSAPYQKLTNYSALQAMALFGRGLPINIP